jgi:acetyl/propionyl-CoA carboxylase alpha subunit
MKYLVRVDGTETEIVVDSDGVRLGAEHVAARVSEIEGTPVRLLNIGNEVHRLVVRRGPSRGEYIIWLDGFRFVVEAFDERTLAIRQLAGATAGPAGPAPLRAPMPGMIVRVNVQAGDQVQSGQGLVVMEAMKMENELRANGAGVVKRVLAAPGTAVEKGALLLELE